MNIINDNDLREIIIQNMATDITYFYEMEKIINGIITDIKYQICRNIFDELSPNDQENLIGILTSSRKR